MIQLDISPQYRVLLPDAKKFYVALVGVGGTGGHVALALGRLAWHLKQKGVQVNITFFDHDHVEEKNLGRQLFSPAELGLNKAETMALRLNSALGLSIRAVPQRFQHYAFSLYSSAYGHEQNKLLIGCVDNHHARTELAMATEEQQGRLWWLDSGNAHHNGQVHMGNIYRNYRKYLIPNELGLIKGLPAPHIQAPDLLESDPEPAPAPLSCAELTIREEQSLTVNLQTAAIAAQYCYQFLIRRELTTYETTFTLDPPTTRSQLITETNLLTFKKKLYKDKT